MPRGCFRYHGDRHLDVPQVTGAHLVAWSAAESDSPVGLLRSCPRWWVLNASGQRCRVHFMRNAPAHAGTSGRRVVSAFIATAFAQDVLRQQQRSGGRSPTSSAPSCPSSPLRHKFADLSSAAYPGRHVKVMRNAARGNRQYVGLCHLWHCAPPATVLAKAVLAQAKLGKRTCDPATSLGRKKKNG
jgi:hypothetical protein